MNHQSKIDRFTKYFQEQINDVSALGENLYKKILYSCIMDTLSKARFPKHDNQKRIISFLSHISSNYMSRVSLIQLLFHLDHALSADDKRTSKLYHYAQKETSKQIGGHLCRGHDVDPLYNDVAKLATAKEVKILKLARYAELFYAYRNSLIHGFKEPGHAIEMSSDGTSPYYHSELNGPWQLCFPVDFFRTLCIDGLNFLKKYFQENDIDPYFIYKNDFSDMWTNPEKLCRGTRKNLFGRLINKIKNYL